MATKLSKQLKREIDVDGKPYMVTLSPEGVKLTEKGKRLGREHSWKSLLGMEAGAAGARGPSCGELPKGGPPVPMPEESLRELLVRVRERLAASGALDYEARQ